MTKAAGTAERAAAETMIVHHSPGVRRLTLGADKGYDAAAFVAKEGYDPAFGAAIAPQLPGFPGASPTAWPKRSLIDLK